MKSVVVVDVVVAGLLFLLATDVCGRDYTAPNDCITVVIRMHFDCSHATFSFRVMVVELL
jgi:hypothetical protein